MQSAMLSHPFLYSIERSHLKSGAAFTMTTVVLGGRTDGKRCTLDALQMVALYIIHISQEDIL